MVKDIRICFVGDSLVNGTGDETALGWAGRLCALANQHGAGITYYNLGIRGNTSRDILERLTLTSEVTMRLMNAKEGRVVISCGVNDTLLEQGSPRIPEKESVSNMQSIIELLEPLYPLLVIGPLPVDDDSQNRRIEQINEKFKDKAEAFNVPFIDVYSTLSKLSVYREALKLSDGAHPSSRGYEMIAKVILESKKWWF